MRGQGNKSRTDVSSYPSKNMPPPMQFKHEAPRHPDLPFECSERGTDLAVNVPEYETGGEQYAATGG